MTDIRNIPHTGSEKFTRDCAGIKHAGDLESALVKLDCDYASDIRGDLIIVSWDLSKKFSERVRKPRNPKENNADEMSRIRNRMRKLNDEFANLRMRLTELEGEASDYKEIPNDQP